MDRRLPGILRGARPVAVLTEFDRDDAWASLVLSARQLGIPTYTLTHGAMGEGCVGFYPVLADKIFCWGEIGAAALAAAGLERDRILIGGCPRLTRDLSLSPAEARAKMGLDPQKPLVMLATQNFSWEGRLQQAEVFCRAVHGNHSLSGVVRLHPSDELQGYGDQIARYPFVCFRRNDEDSADESLAAADVVVVHSSGFGGDALVKRRLTVVLDGCNVPLNYGRELVELAVRSAGDFRGHAFRCFPAALVRRTRTPAAPATRGGLRAEVLHFFGDDSARRIAEHVRRETGLPEGAPVVQVARQSDESGEAWQ